MIGISVKENTCKRRGFTMVELLVSIGLFSIIVVIAVGGFTRAMRAERQAAAFLGSTSNASLVIEQMVREIRTGYDFCMNGQTCASENELAFKNAKRETVTYCTSGGVVLRGIGGGACGGPGFEKITADNIAVDSLKFFLLGNLPNDGLPPRITITIGVSPREADTAGNVLHLETTASSRISDS